MSRRRRRSSDDDQSFISHDEDNSRQTYRSSRRSSASSSQRSLSLESFSPAQLPPKETFLETLPFTEQREEKESEQEATVAFTTQVMNIKWNEYNFSQANQHFQYQPITSEAVRYQYPNPTDDVKLVEEFEMRYQPSLKSQETIDLHKFELIMTLGQGSFGRVLLVVLEPQKIEYALKVLDKSKIVKYKQIEHVRSEIRILYSIQHPNVVIMHSLFKDNSHIYVLMEYVRGGDLFGYMKKSQAFEESVAQFFAAQIVLVFEYLHFFNIVYRDLKPENILVNDHGYLKLADFGFAKRIYQRTYTLCGTPDYFSPEIIQSKGHGKATDWWTLGVLIYELNTGNAPFKGQSEMLLFEAICRKKPPMRAALSATLKDIIQQLLQKDPSLRLGSTAKGAADIKEHPWLSKINFPSIYSQQIPSPFRDQVIFQSLSEYRQKAQTQKEKPLLISDRDDYADSFKDF